MPERLRVVIAEDEPVARERVRRVLTNRAAGVDIVALCETGADAVAAIREELPDLVLLDVEMPVVDGFGVVRQVGAAAMPFTVFVTAHDAFAVRAFEVNALDYILKPFTDERLLEAVERARGRVTERQLGSLQGLLSSVAARPASTADLLPAERPGTMLLEKLLVRQKDEVRVVPVERIDWIEAAGPYSEIHCGEERHLVRISMQELEARLDRRFVRIHRSSIVNLERVVGLQDYLRGEFFVILEGGRKLRLSRSRRVHFEQALGQRL